MKYKAWGFIVLAVCLTIMYAAWIYHTDKIQDLQEVIAEHRQAIVEFVVERDSLEYTKSLARGYYLRDSTAIVITTVGFENEIDQMGALKGLQSPNLTLQVDTVWVPNLSSFQVEFEYWPRQAARILPFKFSTTENFDNLVQAYRRQELQAMIDTLEVDSIKLREWTVDTVDGGRAYYYRRSNLVDSSGDLTGYYR